MYYILGAFLLVEIALVCGLSALKQGAGSLTPHQKRLVALSKGHRSMAGRDRTFVNVGFVLYMNTSQ